MNNNYFSKFLLLSLLINKVILKNLFSSIENQFFQFSINPIKLFNESIIIKDEEKKIFNDSITQKDLINKMGFGWNLGNTLDAFNLQNYSAYDKNSESRWGQPKTTEDMIKTLKNRGFNSIRIPVSWHNHLIDENYTIDPEWMKHVKEIIDWCLKYNLVTILNSHHDNAPYTEDKIKYKFGYFPANKDRVESEKYLYNIWTQIGTAFNNGYDENLIFECMNEPRPEKTSCEWTYKKGNTFCEEASSCINDYNKICLKAIRETEGNNEKRFIMVTVLGAQYHNLLKSDFVFPSDKYNPYINKIILSLHMYFPYDFAFNSNTNYKTFDDRIKNDFYFILRNLYDNYVLRGYHIIIGEMGCVNKNNTEERVKWANFYIQTTRKFQMSCLIWDNGGFNNQKSASETFGLFHRKELTFEPEELVSALIESSKTELLDNAEEIYESNLINDPVTFKDWKVKIYLDYIKFSGYNSFNKLCFTKIDTDPKQSSRTLKISFADWTSSVTFNKSDVEGGDSNSGGTIKIVDGTQNVKIFLNNSICNIIQSKGLVFDGNGFIITNVSISGPRFVKMEPKRIISSNIKQILKLYFNEDASVLSKNIKLINFYYNINNQIECKVNNDNNKIIICEGIFNFTGEYFLKDINNYSLTNKFLEILPKNGENYNINKLIEERVIFDYEELNKEILLPKELFKEINLDTKLTIEITELNMNIINKNLIFFSGISNQIIKFDSKDINVTIKTDGSLEVPSGRELIVINLKNYDNIFMNEGIVIKGYGFAVNSIYLNEIINNNNNNNDDDNTNKDEKNGISGWIIFLIIFILIIFILVGIFIVLHLRKKNIVKDINTAFKQNEKMLN